MRILVVDDDRRMRDVLRRALESEGYEVHFACDGDEALSRVSTEKPNVMIIDVAMPGTDGITVCKLLRQSGADLPILVLTASGERDIRRAAHDAGANAFLAKPFALHDLLSHVRHLLASSLVLPLFLGLTTAASVA